VSDQQDPNPTVAGEAATAQGDTFQWPDGFQQAVRGLHARLDLLPHQAEVTLQMLAPLAERVQELRGLAARLKAIGDGADPAVQPAMAQGREHFTRQAEAIRPVARAATERRKQLLHLMRIQRLSIRDVLDGLGGQQSLFQAAHAIGQSRGKEHLDLRRWLQGQVERWQPKRRGAGADALEKIARILPRHGGAGPSPVAAAPVVGPSGRPSP
jgi:hypothetical protein